LLGHRFEWKENGGVKTLVREDKLAAQFVSKATRTFITTQRNGFKEKVKLSSNFMETVFDFEPMFFLRTILNFVVSNPLEAEKLRIGFLKGNEDGAIAKEYFCKHYLEKNDKKTFDAEIESWLQCSGFSHRSGVNFCVNFGMVIIIADVLVEVSHSERNVTVDENLFQRILVYFTRVAEATERLKLESTKRIQAEKHAEDLNSLLQDFSHEAKHLIHPENVSSVVEYLKNDVREESQEKAWELADTYDSELKLNDLSSQFERRLEGPKEFRKSIRGSISCEGDQDVTILDIINDALFHMVRRFYNPKCRDYTRARESRPRDLEVDLKAFKHEVFFENEKTCLEWLNENWEDFFVSVSDKWKSVRVIKNSPSEFLLKMQLGELLRNATNYNDYTKKGGIKIKFSEARRENIDYLTITTENPTKRIGSVGTRNGLAGIEDALNKLNSTRKKSSLNNVEIVAGDSEFKVTLRYKENLFLLT